MSSWHFAIWDDPSKRVLGSAKSVRCGILGNMGILRLQVFKDCDLATLTSETRKIMSPRVHCATTFRTVLRRTRRLPILQFLRVFSPKKGGAPTTTNWHSQRRLEKDNYNRRKSKHIGSLPLTTFAPSTTKWHSRPLDKLPNSAKKCHPANTQLSPWPFVYGD